ncbi:anti-sigma factor [Leptolyngbya cf. ectocarpi LEGE 11479]|uniref:Anti-sigma factor n=1 Tax=Leptolyngbya cf. ectocarpi LEGE 11479 TaxID=1828722 RepID=A0A928X135_LEPEC|nr:anti-sigma factor [Leptolyngbya ectocarpi]MBE9066497.1 anti-sigma factor [Leptolyngbya cf. ectocarpi LEGE 11479]
MTKSPSENELQRLIAGYVLYDLTPEEATSLAALVADNPMIVQEIEQLQQTLEQAYGPPEISPPAHLYERILGSSSVPPVSRSRRWQLNPWGLLAASLVAGLGLSNIVLWRSLQTMQAQLSQLQPAVGRTVVLTSATDAVPKTSAVLVEIDPITLQATLTGENLSVLPDGKVYALWTVLQPEAPFTKDAKNAILTQTFTVDEQGQVSLQIPLPGVYQNFQWIRAISITIESAEAPQRHEASPILMENLI